MHGQSLQPMFHDKLESHNFRSGQRMQQIYSHYYGGADLPDSWLFAATMFALAWFTIVAELLLGPGLVFKRVRPWALGCGVLLHAGIYLTVPVFTFTMTMFVLYLAVVDPERIHRVIDELLGNVEMGVPPLATNPGPGAQSRVLGG